MRKLVVGAGKSGVAAANFLARRGESVVLSDSKPDPALPYQLDESVVRKFGPVNIRWAFPFSVHFEHLWLPRR